MFDLAFLQITFVFIILVIIALWQNLKPFAIIMSGVYFFFLLFILLTPNKSINSHPEVEDILTESETQKSFDLNNQIVDSIKVSKRAVDNKIDDKPIIKKAAKKIVESKAINKNSNVKSLEKIKPNDLKTIKTNLIVDENPIRVKTFQLGLDIINRELININSTFSILDERIYCMTNIQNQNNSKIIFHKWYLNETLVSKIKMEIGRSYNWRTWSYININPNRAGDWKVIVSDTLDIEYDSLFFSIKDIDQ